MCPQAFRRTLKADLCQQKCSKWDHTAVGFNPISLPAKEALKHCVTHILQGTSGCAKFHTSSRTNHIDKQKGLVLLNSCHLWDHSDRIQLQHEVVITHYQSPFQDVSRFRHSVTYSKCSQKLHKRSERGLKPKDDWLSIGHNKVTWYVFRSAIVHFRCLVKVVNRNLCVCMILTTLCPFLLCDYYEMCCFFLTTLNVYYLDSP